MNYCHARHCDKWLYFPGEKPVRFYRPYRCGEDALPGELLCAKCKTVTPAKTQLSRGFNHGLIDDLIPPKSHAYGGEWYLSMVAKYGEPAKEVLAEATEYLEEDFELTAGSEIAALFRAGMSSTKVEMPSRRPAAAAASPKKRSSGNTKTASLIPAAVLEKISINIESFTPRIVEALTEPLDVCEVEHIEIEPFKFDGEKYYINPETSDIYARLPNKAIGHLIGKFNEDAQAIVPTDDE